ncbi:HPF/RaiA family ribosome-associated protein [Herminiimonas sp. CN]|uniref:HPF/RaiA family ribosome-associated protein n=1 Tax=Herminiimonas sp. CN TaxID=1349818 RepID=UPI000473687C|nr:HPF/RaiA family ribosome-associated protein [Herminiimonas sp. CN]
MQIQVNTDSNIERNDGLIRHVETVVQGALSHFKGQVTRVEVHLSDTNGPKAGAADNRCLMEVRLQGYQPIAVTEHAPSLHQSIQGAADKLKRSVDSALGRLGANAKARPVLADEAAVDDDE